MSPAILSFVFQHPTRIAGRADRIMLFGSMTKDNHGDCLL